MAFDASADERDTRGFISMTSDLAGLAVEGELHVGAAGLDADGPDDRQRGVAQRLELGVGQGHRGRHGHRVAGVDAHRIDVLDRADDHRVVVAIAHDLELELAPTEHRLFEQHLPDRARVEGALESIAQLVRGRMRRRRPRPPSVNPGRRITGKPI